MQALDKQRDDLEGDQEPICVLTTYFCLPSGKSEPVTQIVRQFGDRLTYLVDQIPRPSNLVPTSTTPEKQYLATEIGMHGLLRSLDKAGYLRDLDSLRKLDILDLGCGSEEFRTGKSWPPILCRELHKLGIHVVGVDQSPPNLEGKDEGWEFRQLNLLKPQELATFASNSFDVIVMNLVLGHTEPGMTTPGIADGHFENLRDPHYKRIERGTFEHALAILRPGGIFSLNYGKSVYKKVLQPDHFYRFELVAGSEGFNDLPQRFLDQSALVFE